MVHGLDAAQDAPDDGSVGQVSSDRLDLWRGTVEWLDITRSDGGTSSRQCANEGRPYESSPPCHQVHVYLIAVGAPWRSATMETGLVK